MQGLKHLTITGKHWISKYAFITIFLQNSHYKGKRYNKLANWYIIQIISLNLNIYMKMREFEINR